MKQPEILTFIDYLKKLEDNQTPDYDYIRNLIKWMKIKNIHNFEQKKQLEYTSIIKKGNNDLLAKKTKRSESKKSSIKSDDRCNLSTADNISHRAEYEKIGRAHV